jgi:hypothetical protein
VLDAFGHNEHLAGRDVDGAFAKIDPQIAFNNYECLVGLRMIMPDEIALQPYDLELVVVHFRQ